MAQRPGIMMSIYGAAGMVQVPRIQTSRIMSEPARGDTLGRNKCTALGILLSGLIMLTGLAFILVGCTLHLE